MIWKEAVVFYCMYYHCGCVKALRKVKQTKLSVCVCVCVYDMFYSTGTMLKRAAASESNTSAPQRTVKAALSPLSVYDIHKGS